MALSVNNVIEDEGHIYEMKWQRKPDPMYLLRSRPALWSDSARHKKADFHEKDAWPFEAEKTEGGLLEVGLADAKMVPLAKIREQEHLLALIKERN